MTGTIHLEVAFKQSWSFCGIPPQVDLRHHNSFPEHHRAGGPGTSPDDFSISPGVETPQPQWETRASAHSLASSGTGESIGRAEKLMGQDKDSVRSEAELRAQAKQNKAFLWACFPSSACAEGADYSPLLFWKQRRVWVGRELRAHLVASPCHGQRKGKASLGGLEPPPFRLTAERANRLRHRDSHRDAWSASRRQADGWPFPGKQSSTTPNGDLARETPEP